MDYSRTVLNIHAKVAVKKESRTPKELLVIAPQIEQISTWLMAQDLSDRFDDPSDILQFDLIVNDQLIFEVAAMLGVKGDSDVSVLAELAGLLGNADFADQIRALDEFFTIAVKDGKFSVSLREEFQNSDSENVMVLRERAASQDAQEKP